METLTMNSMHALLKDVASLPSMPAIAARIIREVKRDKIALSELADVVTFDPALTTKILRVANSSFYSLPYKVDSLEKAVRIIGFEALKNIALSFVIVKGFKGNTHDDFDHDFFWRRAITAAVSADLIASKLQIKRDDTFVTSLLMDIGVLIIYMLRPNDYLRALDEKKVSHVTTCEAEKGVFGFDHQDVGGEILKQWDIPENIYMPIACHHKTSDCPSEVKNIVDVLMLADLSSSVYHGSRSIEKFMELKRGLQNKLNMSDHEVSEFVDLIAEKTIEVLSSFEVDASDMKPYSQILQEANEELGKLNLSYEQVMMELKQAKDLAEKFAVEAWEAKEKLRELAVRDGLTNLFNHRYFQEYMDNELERTERYSREVSLIMIDIDHFKHVNDTYGHPNGDMVLRSMSDMIQKTIRANDIVARYGGEEFVVVLPETGIKGAVVLAERLRILVSEMELTVNDNPLDFTISLGVTTYDPEKGRKKKAEIIALADKALYNSKKTGRNKLSIMT